MYVSISLSLLSRLCSIATASWPSERGWQRADLVALESSHFLAVQLVEPFLLFFSPHYHQGMIAWTKSGRVSSTVSAVIVSFFWCMRLHLSYWVLLGICSERLMDNLHAVSSAGSGSSRGFLPGLTLHLDFMMCLKKKLTASGESLLISVPSEHIFKHSSSQHWRWVWSQRCLGLLVLDKWWHSLGKNASGSSCLSLT